MAFFHLLAAAALLLRFPAAQPLQSRQPFPSLEPSWALSAEPPLRTATSIGRPYSVLQTNDDGWADSNIREFYKSLTAAGFNSIISAPADDRTGKGLTNRGPWPVDGGCHHDSCPHHSPPTGRNSSEPRLNFVGGTPVAAMEYGVDELGPKWFHGAPDIVVSGPNQGKNTCNTAGSGTLGAAFVAAGQMGIAAIAFSGMTERKTAWDAPVPLHSQIYGNLSTTITDAVVNSGPPYLPSNTFLNVNYPEVREEKCSSVEDFRFVLTRLHHTSHYDDVETCGSTRLPVDCDVIASKGCYVSISVAKADTEHIGSTAEKEQQADVLDRLQSILSCLGDN